MKFIPVEKIPERGRVCAETKTENKPVKQYLDEFMNMNVKCAKVYIRFDEYADVGSAYVSLRSAVKRHVFPIDVCLRDYEIYFVRRDI